MFRKSYGEVFDGDERWNALDVPTGDRFAWDDDSTYVRQPPYFEDMPRRARAGRPTSRARACSRCSATASRPTTSRPRARSRRTARPGRYLQEHGVERKRLQLLRRAARQPRGDDARHVREHPPAQPARAGHRGRRHAATSPTTARQMSIYDAAMRYAEEGTPLVVLAGKEYGSGSSRDWAAKGTNLLGVRAVIAESFERIHRSNLVGMGVLPLQFTDGESAESLGLTGHEVVLDRRHRGRPTAVPREVTVQRRRQASSPCTRADRHAEGAALLPPRRDPAVRAAPAAGARLSRRLCRGPAAPPGPASVSSVARPPAAA